MFWIFIAILLLIALAFVTPSLLRNCNTLHDARREQNIFIANEQLKELETRFEKGEIDKEDYETSKDELERSLLSDVNDSEDTLDQLQPSPKRSIVSALLIALLIPLIAIPVYLKVGNLTYTTKLDPKEAVVQQSQNSVPMKADGTPDIDAMVAGLQKKMEENPDNAKGWYMLGRSYMVLKRYSDAVNSYEKAYQLKPNSADIMLSLADALAMTKGGNISGRPAELIDKSLSMDPNNLTALWLGGMASRQQNDNVTAIKRWKKVLALVSDPAERQEVSSLIADAAKLLTPAQKIELGVGQPAAATAVNNTTLAGKETDNATKGKGISLKVSLSDEMKDKVAPTDYVFIYAKAMSGPPMPLAAAKVQVKDLPAEIELNDSMAMIPTMKISSFPKVIVGARISKSGQPIAQNGDLFTEKPGVELGQKVELNINQVVKK